MNVALVPDTEKVKLAIHCECASCVPIIPAARMDELKSNFVFMVFCLLINWLKKEGR